MTEQTKDFQIMETHLCILELHFKNLVKNPESADDIKLFNETLEAAKRYIQNREDLAVQMATNNAELQELLNREVNKNRRLTETDRAMKKIMAQIEKLLEEKSKEKQDAES